MAGPVTGAAGRTAIRRACLALPTNRECAAAIRGAIEEADWAARHFGIPVSVLVLDSAGSRAYAAHAEAIARTPRTGPVEVVHLDEDAQRRILDRVIAAAGVPGPAAIAEMMLPTSLSYGACTNRVFLIAAALGCDSVHRRDSDSRYQVRDGEPVYPIRHELASLGRPAGAAVPGVTETALAPELTGRPVVLAGASFIGAMSVDIADIRDLDRDVYDEVVGLWAPHDATEEERRKLAAASFTGAGNDPFTRDRSTLTVVDPMRIDMCNIAFYRVHEEVPLPPATDTIGSDYFLMHLVHDAGLPGVVHNRHIVNFHTPDRRTDAGAAAYHVRLAKFFLSMLYLHRVYAGMALTGDGLLESDARVRAGEVLRLVRAAGRTDPVPNEKRLDRMTAAYRRLGGRYAQIAEDIDARRAELIAAAHRDNEDFAHLTEVWQPLARAARATTVH